MLTSVSRSSSGRGSGMSVAAESFGIYIQQNNDKNDRKVFIVKKGTTIEKLKKEAAKELKLKAVKRLFLFSGVEVKFVDELKQDDELFASVGEDFYKSTSTEPTQEFSISVLGSGGVGKSAITIRYIRGVFVNHWDPTVEDAYSKATTVDGATCRLKILDTAGQDNFESMRSHWLKDKNAYVFVYALDSEQSFKDLARYVKLHEEINADKEIPIVVAANKVDLIRKDPSLRQVSEENGKALAEKLRGLYVETSALSGENINEMFEILIRKCRNDKRDIKPLVGRCAIV